MGKVEKLVNQIKHLQPEIYEFEKGLFDATVRVSVIVTSTPKISRDVKNFLIYKAEILKCICSESPYKEEASNAAKEAFRERGIEKYKKIVEEIIEKERIGKDPGQNLLEFEKMR